MPTEEMVVLARSLKLGGRCLAGISTLTGEWVRPVSGRSTGELYPAHCAVDGEVPRLLDVVRFEHEGGVGDAAQPENVRIARRPWSRVGRLSRDRAFAELRQHVVEGPELLGNRGKAVPEEVAAEGVEASLALVEPAGVEWHLVQKPGGAAQARTRFDLAGRTYDLALTDFAVRPRLLRHDEFRRYGSEELGLPSRAHTLFTVSLAEAHDGWHTKLVAAALFLP